MSTGFHDILFPIEISYGSKGGPEFNTTVLSLASGFEKRNVNWSQLRCKYDVAHGVKTMEQMTELLAFFIARQGKAYSFRFKDFLDYQVASQVIGTGNGTKTAFQLVKTYISGSYTYTRLITKPVVGTITGVHAGGTVYTENVGGGGGFHVDYTTGILTFNQPVSNGVDLIVGTAEFDTHVRFDIDHFDATHDQWETMSWTSVPLVEVKEKTL